METRRKQEAKDFGRMGIGNTRKHLRIK